MLTATQTRPTLFDVSERFYPEALPRFPFEPTRDRFAITQVGDSVGEGVTTRCHFMPGDILFGFTGFFTSEITQFTLQVHEGLHLHDPYFMGKVLHSCDPNATCDMTRRLFIAIAPIAPGDFITMDYAQTEDYLFKTFECQCGAPHCRGEVKGRKQT